MTDETEESPYGVPDKPEKSASMSHGGWIGGDSDAMLGVKKEKKWSKPAAQVEKDDAGGEHFHTEWLGAPASPVKKWKKPEATEKPNSDWIGGGAILSPVRKWKQSGARTKNDINVADNATSPQPSGAPQVRSEGAEAKSHVVSDTPDNTELSEAGDEHGSVGAANPGVSEISAKKIEPAMKKVPQLVSETPEPSETDKQDCEYGVPDKPEGGVPGMRHGGWIGGDSDALLGVEKEKRWSKPHSRSESKEVGGEHLNTDWLGVPASPVKKWKKPAVPATEKPNSDWIGGTIASPVKKWTKSPPKPSSDASKQVSQVPEELSHDAVSQTPSVSDHHQEVSERGDEKDHDGQHKDESEASGEKTEPTMKQVPRLVSETPEPSETGDKQDYEYGVPDKPEGGVPGMRHGGWIGGDSDELLGVKKERRWSKATTRQEKDDVGGEHLNTDWLGSPAVTTTRKWKKPVVPATEKPNSDWLGGTVASPVRKWKQSGARLKSNTDTPKKASEAPEVSETTIPGDVHDDDIAPKQNISKSSETVTEQKMKKVPQLVSETPEPSETGSKQDCEYGVPDKPEGGVPGMRHGGWIGGDSDALLGVEKEKRWSKPQSRLESKEVGGEHLNTDWLGVPASPVKKWKKPVS